MTRNRVSAIFLLMMAAGCGGRPGSEYEVECPLVWPGHPTVINLPYEKTLNNGYLRLSIRAIPDRTDAVQVVAMLTDGSFRELPAVEWTQEGCGMKKIELNKGRAVYDFDFLELCPSGDAVREVKMRIVYRAKLGLR